MEGWKPAFRGLTGLARRAAKQVAATALDASGTRLVLREVERKKAGGRRVQILAWHRVVPDFERMRRRVIPGLLTSTGTFDRQLSWLGTRFRFGTMEEAREVLAGNMRLDRDLCVVTFDDGYADFLEHALPILQRHRAPSTLYIAPGYIGSEKPLLHDRLHRLLLQARRHRVDGSDVPGDEKAQDALRRALALGDAIDGLEWLLETKPRSLCLQVAEALESWLGEDPCAAWENSRLLSWQELLAARDGGATIGAHTVDHVCLPNESSLEVERQLQLSKSQLEERLGSGVQHFAYPNGWYSPSVVRAVGNAGFRTAVTTEDRQNRLFENPLLLKRKSVWEFTSRGVVGFSQAVHACNFDGTMALLGISSWTPGEKPDGVGGQVPVSGEAPFRVKQVSAGA